MRGWRGIISVSKRIISGSVAQTPVPVGIISASIHISFVPFRIRHGTSSLRFVSGAIICVQVAPECARVRPQRVSVDQKCALIGQRHVPIPPQRVSIAQKRVQVERRRVPIPVQRVPISAQEVWSTSELSNSLEAPRRRMSSYPLQRPSMCAAARPASVPVAKQAWSK